MQSQILGDDNCNLAAILPISHPSPGRKRVRESESERGATKQTASLHMIRDSREDDERDNN